MDIRLAITGAQLITMVRDQRYKITHIVGSDEGQLFDLQEDPQEERNLWFDPAHNEQKQRLEAEGILREITGKG